MAKTIRPHPTSPFVLPEPTFLTTLIFSRFGPKMDLHFLQFPTSLQVKRLGPKGKKMRMDHPFILEFCQHVTFDNSMYYHFFTVWSKPTFFNYCHILIVLCISDSNMGDTHLLLLFQNRTLTSK